MIISSLPAWALLLLLVIDGVVLTVWALPSRPQSVIAAKRLARNVRSACLQQDSLGIAIGFMTYLGREDDEDRRYVVNRGTRSIEL